jgi:hypothetical protein
MVICTRFSNNQKITILQINESSLLNPTCSVLPVDRLSIQNNRNIL